MPPAVTSIQQPVYITLALQARIMKLGNPNPLTAPQRIEQMLIHAATLADYIHIEQRPVNLFDAKNNFHSRLRLPLTCPYYMEKHCDVIYPQVPLLLMQAFDNLVHQGSFDDDISRQELKSWLGYNALWWIYRIANVLFEGGVINIEAPASNKKSKRAKKTPTHSLTKDGFWATIKQLPRPS